MQTNRELILSLFAMAFVFGCTTSPGPKRGNTHPPKPMVLTGSAYECAGRIEIPKIEAVDYSDLHNVIRLSPQIVSGSEPLGRPALERLQHMGIRTILSVDGKVPDVEHAQKLGMRYVHIPIQYKGITPDQVARMAKMFRELDGPFYVHCFHGKHRGPAAAAVGRVVLDGASREIAIAEMRQCGTAAKYEGLYRTLAEQALPSAAQSSDFEYGFDPVHRPDGLVGVMVHLARAKDNLVLAERNGWQPDPKHPDIDALQEARKMLETFETAEQLDECRQGADDYRGWFLDSTRASRALVNALQASTKDRAAASANFKIVRNACSKCHREYRN